MARDYDEDDADDEIDEGPDPSDLHPDESEDDSPTDECPHCGREIHADTIGCPYCGESPDRQGQAWSWWVWVGIVAAGAVLLTLVFR